MVASMTVMKGGISRSVRGDHSRIDTLCLLFRSIVACTLVDRH